MSRQPLIVSNAGLEEIILARVKGPVLVSTLKYLQQKYGKEGVTRVLRSLSLDEQKVLNGSLLMSKWYPRSLLIHLMKASRLLLAQGDTEFYRNCGRASADYAVNTVYKLLFILASPSFIAQQGSIIYGTFYSTGRLRVVDKGRHIAVAELTDLDGHPEVCGRVWGWLERTLELAGAKSVRVTHPQCMCNMGQSVCRFEGAWQ